MTRLALLSLLLTQSPAVAALSGTVVSTGRPVADAFIRVIDNADSTKEAQAVTDAKGDYSMVLPPQMGTGIGSRDPVGSKEPGAQAATMGFAYDLNGRTLRAFRPGAVWTQPRLPETAARALPKSAGPRGFKVLITAKGMWPYQGGADLDDPGNHGWNLAPTDLWDSTRVILRSELANSAARFRGEKQGRVAFLGGSITNGGGWRDSVCAYLKAKFPGTVFDFINAGIPSMGSDMHGFRLRRDVLEKGRVDLLFIESAVNDTTNKVTSKIRLKAYEGLVRQGRRANPLMDIVFLYFLDPSFYPLLTTGKTPAPIADYEKIAVPYGIASVNLAQYVAERYTWEQFGANVHPGPLGHGIYYRNIRRLLEVAWSTQFPATGPHPGPARLLDSACFHLGHTDSISKAVAVKGWKRVDSWTPTVGGTRDGFFKVPVLESTAPGDTLKFPFTGSAVGIVVPAGPDVGMLEYAIDGKVQGTLDQFTPWSSGLHIPWTYLFGTDLPYAKHELRLVTSAAKNAQSKGTACRIIRFVVNGSE